MIKHTPKKNSLYIPEIGEKIEEKEKFIEVFAHSKLPTRYGDFDLFIFHNNIDQKEHIAIVSDKNKSKPKEPWVRIHSECFTGDVLRSLRCDCSTQLEKSFEILTQKKYGIILYMRQEGRGIGLGNKIRAYALQEKGLNTYEANKNLGFDDDLRDYKLAAWMLRLFKIQSIVLATNNPAKINGLLSEGIDVKPMPLIGKTNPHNRDYLISKTNSGHTLTVN